MRLPLLSLSWLTACLFGVVTAFSQGGDGRIAAPHGSETAAEPTPKWEAMDYGPFFCATIDTPVPGGNVTNKGIAIKVGPHSEGTMLFDTDLMRWSAGSVGGFLRYQGIAFDSKFGANPLLKGDLAFSSSVGPGWGFGDNLDDLTDRRERPFGRLPDAWAKYRGLYLNGDRVILSHTVGDAAVLELPGLDVLPGGNHVFTRTITIGPTSVTTSIFLPNLLPVTSGVRDPSRPPRLTNQGPRPMLVLRPSPQPDVRAMVGLVDAPKGIILGTTTGSRVVVRLPPLPDGATFMIGFGQVAAEAAPEFENWLKSVKAPADLRPLTRGGPMHWPQTVETRGVLATSTTTDGAYTVDTLTAPDANPYHSWMKFGGFDFFHDGHRAAICTLSGDVWVVSGIDDKLEHLQWKRFASGLFQPLGLKIVRDEVYVTCRDGLIRLRDLNGDGEADFYEAFNNDVIVTPAFHEFALDLQTDSKGNFFFAKAGPVSPNSLSWELISPHHGIIARVSPDGKKFDIYASGARVPNGLGMGPHDELTMSDNEGVWTPACRLNLVKEGDFLGVPDLAHTSPLPGSYGNPVCWVPHGDVDNSSGGQAWVTDERWGPFNGHILNTSYGKCALFLVMREDVGGLHQGGVVRFPLEFESGIMRARFNADDGQLYVCGLGGWGTTAVRDGAFQRVRYTGKTVAMPTGVHVKHDQIEIEFTTPLSRREAEDLDNFACEQWNYQWTKDYGSPEFSVTSPNLQGHDPVPVTRSILSADGKTLTLQIPGLVPVMQMKIKFRLKTATGTSLGFEIYNTIAKVP